MVEQDLTTNDVAGALRLNKVTVQRLLKEGRIQGYQVGRSWRIPKAAVDEFRANGLRSVGRPPIVPVKTDIFDFDEWERALFAEDGLAAAPAISLESMRRENMYED